MSQSLPTSLSASALDDLCMHTLRFLAVDTVHKADRVPPGLPMAAAAHGARAVEGFFETPLFESSVAGPRLLCALRKARLFAAVQPAAWGRLRFPCIDKERGPHFSLAATEGFQRWTAFHFQIVEDLFLGILEGEGHMLRSMSDLEGYAIAATDGNIGHVTDFYFDDEAWVIRFLVVDTGSWLPSRKVLISPIAIGHPNWTEKILPVSINKEQVKNSPDIDTEKPVSRQHEMRYLGYYGYPNYWGGAGLWGAGAYPNLMRPGYPGFISRPQAIQSEVAKEARSQLAQHQEDDPHLRSCKAIVSYHIEATDGDIGHVQGLLVDEETWAVRYIVVKTSNWWLGHQVLVAPQWIQDVRWRNSTVSVNLTRQAVKNAPSYDSTERLNREQEKDIYKHYGRRGYWTDE